MGKSTMPEFDFVYEEEGFVIKNTYWSENDTRHYLYYTFSKTEKAAWDKLRKHLPPCVDLYSWDDPKEKGYICCPAKRKQVIMIDGQYYSEDAQKNHKKQFRKKQTYDKI